MRTQEQIIQDCEEKYKEIQEEAEKRDNDPKIQKSCHSCKFCYRRSVNLYNHYECEEPLVKGFKKEVFIGKQGRSLTDDDDAWSIPMPCGPEKALWKPKVSIFRRIYEYLCS